MHPGSSRLLCDAADRILYVIGRGHHQVGKLVDDNDDLGKLLLVGIVCDGGIVALEIAHAFSLDQLIAALHLGHRPMKCTCRLLRLTDHRDKQVRQTVVYIQLDLLRVDEDKLNLVGSRLEEQAHENAVNADRLTHTGGTCNENVRHLRNVHEDRLSGNVHAQRHADLALILRKAGIFEELTQPDGSHHLVGHLNADSGFARDGSLNTNARGSKIQGDIVHKIDNRAHLDTLLRGKLIACDGGTAGDIHDAGTHLEASQGFHQLGGVCVQLLADIGVGGRSLQLEQRHGRKLIGLGRRCLILLGSIVREGSGRGRRGLDDSAPFNRQLQLGSGFGGLGVPLIGEDSRPVIFLGIGEDARQIDSSVGGAQIALGL